MPAPPTAVSGSESIFMMHVGYCIATWSEVEQKLFKICWKGLRSPEAQAAVVYYRTPNISLRFSLTDELVLLALPKPQKKNGGHAHRDVKKWNEIKETLGGLLKVRNRIAHHASTIQIESPPYGNMLTLSWHENNMSQTEQLRGQKVPAGPLVLDDLKSHHKRTLDLVSQLDTFLTSILSKHVP
jgi:hypothetical protein